MTLASLIEALKGLTSEVWPYSTRMRPQPRYIVYQVYGASGQYGDNVNLFDFPRVQLDVYTQDPEDPLPGRVCALLRENGCAYEIIDQVYDDDLALFWSILRFEVIG